MNLLRVLRFLVVLLYTPAMALGQEVPEYSTEITLVAGPMLIATA